MVTLVAIGEGSLALAAIIAATAGFATLADWQAVYHGFGQGGVGAFINGGANILQQGLGLDTTLSQTLLTVMVVLFAGTTMDTGFVCSAIFSKSGGIFITLVDAKSTTRDALSGWILCFVSVWCWWRWFG
ncbi:hypothetical protein ACT691_05410 [Vibrio metschnikovii]